MAELKCSITGKELDAKPNDSLLDPISTKLRLRIIAETSTDGGKSFYQNYIGPDGVKELTAKLTAKKPTPKKK